MAKIYQQLHKKDDGEIVLGKQEGDDVLFFICKKCKTLWKMIPFYGTPLPLYFKSDTFSSAESEDTFIDVKEGINREE